MLCAPRGLAADKARAVLALLGLEALASKPVAELPSARRARGGSRARSPRSQAAAARRAGERLIHEEVGKLGALIRELRGRLRLTILLVEHHMSL